MTCSTESGSTRVSPTKTFDTSFYIFLTMKVSKFCDIDWPVLLCVLFVLFFLLLNFILCKIYMKASLDFYIFLFLNSLVKLCSAFNFPFVWLCKYLFFLDLISAVGLIGRGFRRLRSGRGPQWLPSASRESSGDGWRGGNWLLSSSR